MRVPGTVVVSVLADAAPDLLPRLTDTLARLDLLPQHVYARLRVSDGDASSSASSPPVSAPSMSAPPVPSQDLMMEVDFHLSGDGCGRRDRLIKLFGTVVGVRGVVCSA